MISTRLVQSIESNRDPIIDRVAATIRVPIADLEQARHIGRKDQPGYQTVLKQATEKV
jgi:hypothetical protein